jgi:hypothetical protein
MLPYVIVVRELRQSIKDQHVCCSHCRFLNGSGMRLGWTLLSVCLVVEPVMTSSR